MVVIEISGRKGAGKTTLASILTQKFKNLGLSVINLSFAEPIKKILLKMYITKDGLYEILFDNYFNVYKKNFDNFYNDYFKPKLIEKIYHECIKNDIDKIIFFTGDLKKSILKGYERNESLIITGIKKYLNCEFEKGYRILAQTIGTEILRNHLFEDIFVYIVKRKILKLVGNVDLVIIDDFRFPNEDLSDFVNFNVLNEKSACIKILVSNVEDSEDSSSLDLTSRHISENSYKKINFDYKIVRKKDKYLNFDMNEFIGFVCDYIF